MKLRWPGIPNDIATTFDDVKCEAVDKGADARLVSHVLNCLWNAVTYRGVKRFCYCDANLCRIYEARMTRQHSKKGHRWEVKLEVK
jgi:hypothetical protein